MHCFFAELEPSFTVTEQNLADRVRYIMRSNIFDDAELERLRLEAVPSSDENCYGWGCGSSNGRPARERGSRRGYPVVGDSNDDGIVSHELELEHMRSTLEEAIV
ncbi:unnamed protein product [Parnassius apollo]|uniref:(apollo) hypothetical protein n=1 Tax=Parnassius apollo TaxID=110799 RepID=A0A8S3X9L3_PARAO|nr:unnamed protein product [Parnassius apollo]